MSLASIQLQMSEQNIEVQSTIQHGHRQVLSGKKAMHACILGLCLLPLGQSVRRPGIIARLYRDMDGKAAHGCMHGHWDFHLLLLGQSAWWPGSGSNAPPHT